MLTFQQRRDTILSQFAQAKADLETLMPHLFSSLCKSSRVRCIRSTTVDTTKSLFVHVKCLYCRGKRISGEIGRRLVSVVKMHE